MYVYIYKHKILYSNFGSSEVYNAVAPAAMSQMGDLAMLCAAPTIYTVWCIYGAHHIYTIIVIVLRGDHNNDDDNAGVGIQQPRDRLSSF